MSCAQEMCPNWSGDGRVCPCAVFGIEPPRTDPYGESYVRSVPPDLDDDEEEGED